MTKEQKSPEQILKYINECHELRIIALELKLAKAIEFIKAECYCEMDGDIPKHCKNCQFLEALDD